MATIKLRVRGKKNPSPIYMRFINGRNLDIEIKLNVFVDPSTWDKKNEKIRNLISVKNRDVVNMQLTTLKNHVLNEYNESFMYGKIIDVDWLQETSNTFFKRPKNENKLSVDNKFIYLYDYGIWWIENKADTWNTKNAKHMNVNQVRMYSFALMLLKEFQGSKKIKFPDVNKDFFYKFIDFLRTEKDYSSASIQKHYAKIRFFVNRARAEGIKNIGSLDGKIFIENDIDNDVIVPYLNETEISKIMKLDLSHDSVLDSVRDLFIISLWTGLRISDFNKNLDISNIEDDYINIKTTKTGAWVDIPLHPNVKSVLNKRVGALPPRIRDDHFNKHIKEVVQLAGIDEKIKGRLLNPENRRKEVGIYEKYKLISAHTGRRSFATNLYGLVHNSVIMSVGGWKREEVMLNYIKKTKREHSETLKKKWDEKYQ